MFMKFPKTRIAPPAEKEIPEFSTETDAREWMREQVNDDCVDNYRFSFLNDEAGMMYYDEVAAGGCCGSFDAEVTICGDLATIGCNYGH